jgi:YidC/Oxa1 family membrane protein insertase
MDNIRFLLIVAFATISFMLWEAWQADYGPKPALSTLDRPVVAGTTPAQVAPATLNSTAAVADAKIAAAAIIKVKTDLFAIEIDSTGGTIRNLDLLQYPVEKENTTVNTLRALVGMERKKVNLAPTRLFNPDSQKEFAAQSGLIADAGSDAVPDHHQKFNFQQDRYELKPGENTLAIPLTWDNGQGLSVTKTLTFTRGSYGITVSQKITNRSAKVWSGKQYNQFLKTNYVDPSSNTFIRTYTGGVVYTEADKYKKVSFDDMAENTLNQASKGGWTAMIQHYFAAAWIPPADQNNHFYTKELQDSRFILGSESPSAIVPMNKEVEFKAQLYAGPKVQTAMEKYAKGLELTVDYGWLTVIGKPIYWLLNYIHAFVNNWGIAILGVTLCIKLLFFKLSQASYRSMAKMRKIQPQLKALQERFADDKPRFNQEMMEMYKREKVNPLGGCLPIMVQIPVFISLYWVLIETVEIRQAPFLLWIQDLSAQDPFYLLPVLYGISMKVQQSLNPAPVDPVQAKVMQMFPIMLTVFFLFFPSGLVLYWICNNCLSILQQWYITKQIEAAD